MVLFHFLKDAQHDTALSLETRTCVHLVVDEPTGIEWASDDEILGGWLLPSRVKNRSQ